MNTYTWVISQIDCYPQAEGQQDVVFNVHWRCTGSDGTHQADTYSTCPVTYVAGEPFTPYASLTKNQVLGWIWNNGVDKATTEAALDAMIAALVNPPVISPPLPWGE